MPIRLARPVVKMAVTLEREQIELLREIAARDGVPVSAVLRQLLALGIERRRKLDTMAKAI